MSTVRLRPFAAVAATLMIPAVSFAAEPQAPAPAAQALTLTECYELALARSEELAIQQELIKESQGRFLQALSTVAPHVSFVSSDERQDASGESAFRLRNIPNRRFTFTQPLFTGFREFAAIAGSRAERRQRKDDRARAEQLLLVDVADAFHLLQEQREDLVTLEAVRTALSERIEELRQREQLGRSRQSELVSAQAQLRRTEAEIERVRSLDVTAQQLLEFLTGAHIQELAEEPGLPPIGQEADYLARVDERPDVRSADEAWRVARNQVRVTQSELWPAVDLEGNYYTKRAGNSEGIDWDVLLTVDVPIFEGGQTLGRIKEQASRARQVKLRSDRTRRQARLDIQNVYAKLQAAVKRSAALELALQSAEENYRLQAEDYRLSLVNNLDVLQALQTLEDARRDVIHVKHEAAKLYYQLLAATGQTL